MYVYPCIFDVYVCVYHHTTPYHTIPPYHTMHTLPYHTIHTIPYQFGMVEWFGKFNASKICGPGTWLPARALGQIFWWNWFVPVIPPYQTVMVWYVWYGMVGYAWYGMVVWCGMVVWSKTWFQMCHTPKHDSKCVRSNTWFQMCKIPTHYSKCVKYQHMIPNVSEAFPINK